MRLVILFVLCFSLVNPSAAQAPGDPFPSKPVRFIVPFTPGGLPDVLARALGNQLTPLWGQSVIVENRPGSSGITASEFVARSTPDGYTLLLADPQHLAINPAIFSKLPYDPVKDFAPVTLAAYGPFFLVVHPSVPATTFGELVTLVKSKPNALNYGSSGPGSIHHLAMESLKAGMGLQMVHIPYKGGGQSVPALVAGEVSVMFSAYPAIAPQVKAGKVRILAVTTARHTPLAPEVPTIAELGLPGYQFAAQICVMAPAGTPPGVVSRLNADLVRVLKRPDIAERMKDLGIEPAGTTPEELAEIIRTDLQKYATAVKLSGLKVE